MKTKDLVSLLNEKFPLKLQENYDNAGSQILFPEQEISGVLIALDMDLSLLEEAEKAGANLIVTHHPFFFRAFKQIDLSMPEGKIIAGCIKRHISLYAAHTNLDRVFRHVLCTVMGFKADGTLLKDIPDEQDGTGFGSLAFLQEPVTLSDLLALAVEKLNLDHCIYSGNQDQQIGRIAFLNGAGGGSIEKIISMYGPECIITGDVNHHSARYAMEHGVSVIDAGHYGTEHILLDFLKDTVLYCLTNSERKNVPVLISKQEKNPFRVFLKNE